MPNSEVAIGRRMNGSETLMDTRSWLRLGSAGWLVARRRRAGLDLLIALALRALSLLALGAFGLAVLALRAPAALLARCEVGGRGLFVLADDNLGAVGEIGKAGRPPSVGGRQAARDHGIGFVLLRHHDRFGGRDIAVADDIAERSRRAALHRRGWNDKRLRKRIDLEAHIV